RLSVGTSPERIAAESLTRPTFGLRSLHMWNFGGSHPLDGVSPRGLGGARCGPAVNFCPDHRMASESIRRRRQNALSTAALRRTDYWVFVSGTAAPAREAETPVVNCVACSTAAPTSVGMNMR